MRFQTKKVALLLAVCVMLVSASPAFAQSGVQGYVNGGEDVAGALQGGGADQAGTTVSADSGGSLPFTGLDIALILGVGAGLVAVGLATRRLTRPDAA
jgi:hypothetical protein